MRLRGPLKRLAGESPAQEIPGRSVGELLRELERSHPAMSGWVLDERGHIRQHINVFVNGERRSEEAPVADGDRIDVLPAISGG